MDVSVGALIKDFFTLTCTTSSRVLLAPKLFMRITSCFAPAGRSRNCHATLSGIWLPTISIDCSGQSIGNGIVATSEVQVLSLVANRIPNCISIDRVAKRLTPLLPSTIRPTMTLGSTFFGEAFARELDLDFVSFASLA